MAVENGLLYRAHHNLKVGELQRFVISYTSPESPDAQHLTSLQLKVRNTDNMALRAAFLKGPYILYVDVRPAEYHHSKQTFVTADIPTFEPNLQAGQSFNAELSLHTIKDRYVWIVDIVSQIIFSATSEVSFEILISETKDFGRSEKLGCFTENLTVNRLDTVDLWNLPLQPKGKKSHLVILAHGLHGNTGADMHYIKDQVDAAAAKSGEDIVVRGFHGNVCKTEKGVKFLGSRLAEYIVKELYNESIEKISFIGHSLGGLIQTFALAYIEVNYPWFFQKVQPINFITLASPMLGIVTDNPAYVSAALAFGIVGRTGQDLGLQGHNGEEPLLKLLPLGPSHKILKKFQNRTLYANAINDGIVPLYTSSLLFLDWDSITSESGIEASAKADTKDTATNEPPITEKPDFLTKTTQSLINPFQKALSLWTPNTNSFPKTSMIESATSVLIPPLPSQKFITTPGSRCSVIIHDKVYTESDIPKPKPRNKTFIQKIDPIAKYQDLEEDIAREWHKGLSWRKVLVKLEPDAHNNIFVRRRFSNAYGWPVIDHLIENHFRKPITPKETREATPDDINEEMEREADKSNVEEEMDLGTDKRLKHWVNEKYEDTVFDVGPAGMIANFNEVLDNFAKWNTGNVKRDVCGSGSSTVDDEVEMSGQIAEGASYY